MRRTVLGVLSICSIMSACAMQPQVVTPPQMTEYNFDQTEKIYVEVHNNPDWCIVRIWSPEKDEDAPLAIFRGTPGQDTCKIYNIVNPGVAPDDHDREEK